MSNGVLPFSGFRYINLTNLQVTLNSKKFLYYLNKMCVDYNFVKFVGNGNLEASCKNIIDLINLQIT